MSEKFRPSNTIEKPSPKLTKEAVIKKTQALIKIMHKLSSLRLNNNFNKLSKKQRINILTFLYTKSPTHEHMLKWLASKLLRRRGTPSQAIRKGFAKMRMHAVGLPLAKKLYLKYQTEGGFPDINKFETIDLKNQKSVRAFFKLMIEYTLIKKYGLSEQQFKALTTTNAVKPQQKRKVTQTSDIPEPIDSEPDEPEPKQEVVKRKEYKLLPSNSPERLKHATTIILLDRSTPERTYTQLRYRLAWENNQRNQRNADIANKHLVFIANGGDMVLIPRNFKLLKSIKDRRLSPSVTLEVFAEKIEKIRKRGHLLKAHALKFTMNYDNFINWPQGNWTKIIKRLKKLGLKKMELILVARKPLPKYDPHKEVKAALNKIKQNGVTVRIMHQETGRHEVRKSIIKTY